MHASIRREIELAQSAHSRAFTRIEAIRDNLPTIEQIMALGGGPTCWSFWSDMDGLYLGACFNVESIMLDSPIAAVLDGVESILDGEFTSKTIPETGDVEYRLTKPGFGQVIVRAYLTASGTCRKVVKGYETRTQSKTVEVEVSSPIYGVVCGE